MDYSRPMGRGMRIFKGCAWAAEGGTWAWEKEAYAAADGGISGAEACVAAGAAIWVEEEAAAEVTEAVSWLAAEGLVAEEKAAGGFR